MITVEATGWFGVPGRDGGQVHAVANHRPICGTTFHADAQFQWCAHGVHWDYIECSRCKEMLTWRLQWKQVSPHRWERADGAAVAYNCQLMGPETNVTLPGHRGWVAFPPKKAFDHTYLGYFPTRWRRGGKSPMFVPTKFKTADAAIQALQKAFPWPKT